MKKFETVQRKIIKFLCFKKGQNDCNYIERLKILNLLPLSVRRDLKIMKLINSVILNENTPRNWLNLLELKRSQRHGNMIKIPKTRINICDRNVFSYATKLYNMLPLNLRTNDKFILNINNVEKFLYHSFIENFLLEN
jgi:hypothetical protein